MEREIENPVSKPVLGERYGEMTPQKPDMTLFIEESIKQEIKLRACPANREIEIRYNILFEEYVLKYYAGFYAGIETEIINSILNRYGFKVRAVEVYPTQQKNGELAVSVIHYFVKE